jgi:hypothetical protein
MTQDYDDLERRALDALETVRRVADEHSRIIIGTIAIAFLASFFGIINPSIPDWWPLIIWGVVAAVGTAFVASIYLYALIPDKEGILLVSLRGDDDGGEIWELYEDEFEELEVDGTLYEWSESPRRVYEVRDYEPEENAAVANWREAEPASAILEKRTADDAIEFISELREVYEPEAARARRLQRRIRGITRRLDRERTRANLEQMDRETGLEDIDSPAISDILDEEIPDDLHPEAGGGDLDEVDESTENGTNGNVDIELNDDEPLEIHEYADPDEVGL